MVASGGRRERPPPPKPKNIAAPSVTTSESATGRVAIPSAQPDPVSQSASAMPADEICASAAPTNPMRRRTTYTPSTEHARPMTTAPYSASLNRRIASNTMRSRHVTTVEGVPTREHDPMSAELAHLHRNAVHLAQRL